MKGLKLEINKSNIEKVLGKNGLMVNKQEIMVQQELLCALNESFGILNQDIPPYVQKYGENITRVLDLLRVFGEGDNIRSVYKIMKEDNVPIKISDLAINGDDIIKNFPSIEKRKYSSIFNGLLKECCFLPEMNTKDNLLKWIRSKFV